MVKISTELWLVLFVALVAVVGLFILMDGFSLDQNISGQAIKATSSKLSTTSVSTKGITGSSNLCTENDGGNVIGTKGTSKGEWAGSPDKGVKSYTDTCSGEKMTEYYCASGDNAAVKSAGQESIGAVVPVVTDCKATDGNKCGVGVCTYDKTLLPDFSIDFAQIVIYKSTKEAAVNFEVKNNGGSAMSVHDYAIDLEEVFADGTIHTTSESSSDTTTVAAGKTRMLSLSFPVSDAWLSTFETWGDDEVLNLGINIDSSSDVKEQDESNNLYAKEMHESANDIIEG